jgi:hypothetical protein
VIEAKQTRILDSECFGDIILGETNGTDREVDNYTGLLICLD